MEGQHVRWRLMAIKNSILMQAEAGLCGKNKTKQKQKKNTKQNKKTPCNLKLGLVDLKLASQDLALLWS